MASRFQAKLEYDGTDFLGFQIQADGRTVQGELEDALARLEHGQRVPVLGAGRTDSGVHASGQVIAFDLDWALGVEKLQRAINANLSRDVALRGLASAAEDFHPRFSAKGRCYEYRIFNAPVRSPRLERIAWQVWQELNLDEMNLASESLIGRQDFGTFGRAPDKSSNTIRTIRTAHWHLMEGLLLFEIEADAFLYRMVRSIVGMLKQVGAGEISGEEFVTRKNAADRSKCGQTAPAKGLSLVEVRY